MGRKRRKRRKRGIFIFASGLQRSVQLLRNSGLLEKNRFPEIQRPISIIITERKGKKQTVRFIAKIGVRSSFGPSNLFLRFNRRGTSVYISPDMEDWMCISADTKIKISG